MKNRKMRYLYYAFATSMVAVLATACGSKDNGGGGTVAVVPTVGVTCTGCPTSQSLVASALGTAASGWGGMKQAELSVQFFGEAAAVAAVQASGSLYYRGPVVMTGTLRVLYPATTGCNIPAGSYTVQSVSPGNWQNEQFTNLTVTASGPVTLQLQLDYGFISGASPALVDQAGATFPYRVRSDVYVLSSSGGGTCSPIDPYSGRRYPEFYFNL